MIEKVVEFHPGAGLIVALLSPAFNGIASEVLDETDEVDAWFGNSGTEERRMEKVIRVLGTMINCVERLGIDGIVTLKHFLGGRCCFPFLHTFSVGVRVIKHICSDSRFDSLTHNGQVTTQSLPSLIPVLQSSYTL